MFRQHILDVNYYRQPPDDARPQRKNHQLVFFLDCTSEEEMHDTVCIFLLAQTKTNIFYWNV